jgi:hypothetical protein
MAKKKEDSVIARSVATVEVAGQAIEKKDPVKAGYALELMAQGLSFRKVMERAEIGWDALSRLRVVHAQALAERRQQLAQDGFEQAEKLRLLADRKMEMLAEDESQLEKVSLKDLILSRAISQDKAMDALGEGSRVTIEHKTAKVSLEDAMRAITEAREALATQALEVTVKPVEEVKEGTL